MRKSEKHRSNTVAVLNTQIDSTKIINALKAKNLIVSNGYGSGKDKQIRIANFPATSIEEMQQLIQALNNLQEDSFK